MKLLDHVSIAVSDLDAVREFYKAIMSALTVEQVFDEEDVLGFGERSGPGNDEHSYITVRRSAGSVADGARHWCFRAGSAQAVRDFYSAGLATGGRDAGPPGLRSSYHEAYYAAFLFDPAGNKLEAVFHQGDT